MKQRLDMFEGCFRVVVVFVVLAALTAYIVVSFA